MVLKAGVDHPDMHGPRRTLVDPPQRRDRVPGLPHTDRRQRPVARRLEAGPGRARRREVLPDQQIVGHGAHGRVRRQHVVGALQPVPAAALGDRHEREPQLRRAADDRRLRLRQRVGDRRPVGLLREEHDQVPLARGDPQRRIDVEVLEPVRGQRRAAQQILHAGRRLAPNEGHRG